MMDLTSTTNSDANASRLGHGDRGRFITLEGGEGVGKSTQAERLVTRLGLQGIAAVATREPGGSPFAEALRPVLLGAEFPERVPLSDLFLFAAARADHVAATIAPAIETGRWVVCDRFIDSTRAYQGAALGADPEVVAAIESLTVPGLLMPELTLVLDMPAQVGQMRARARHVAAGGGEVDRYEGQDLSFHTRLREAFLGIARREPERCVVVDADQPPDVVADAIWSAVQARMLSS